MNNEIMKILLPYKAIPTRMLKPEEGMCVEFANSMRQLTLENKLPYVWFHVPNEFLPSKRVNYSFDLKQKHMGKISGVPDYCFLGKNNSFFIEFKSPKGKQTPSQKLFEEWCTLKNINYHLCKSYREGMEIVEKYIKLGNFFSEG